MARKIQHKRGLEANLPTLAEAEWALTTDTEKPFFGGPNGNIEIAKKKDVDEALANKANATTVQGLSQTVNAKADVEYVETELAKKADTTALETKADVTALETKADKEEVTTLSTQLAEKATQADVTAAVEPKADKTYVDTELQTKATRNEVRLNTVPIGLNDADSEMLAAIEGGAGTSFELLSIPREKSVTPSKTTFIDLSTNIFRLDNLTSFATISATTGELVQHNTASTTDFIEVEPSKVYTFKGSARIAFYDQNKTFIPQSSLGYDAATSHTVTSPANARYIRFVLSPSDYDTAQANEGDTLLPYEPYHPPKLSKQIKLDVTPEEIFEEKGITNKFLADKSVSVSNLDFIEYPTNLINKYDLTEYTGISGTTGEVIENAQHSTTDFIEVTPSETYSIYYIGRLVFYDANKKFIITSTNYEDVSVTVIAPINARYIRFAIRNDVIDKAQMNVGSTLLPYEPYHKPRFTDAVEVNANGTAAQDPTEQDYFVLDTPISGVYTAPEMPSATTESGFDWIGFGTEEIYAMYDEMMTNHPDYITKTLLGNEPTGLPIYRYDFKPARPPEMEGVVTKFPKVILTTGTHFERTAILTAIRFFQQLCDNWKTDEHLDILRWNVHFIVIPALNPWGVDNASRKNSNGVDLNRNFPTGWKEASSDPANITYRGPEPLSEIEAQLLNGVMEENKDTLFQIDFHNFSSTDNFLWTPGGSVFTINIGKALMVKMSRKWKKEYSFLPQDNTTIFGYSSWNPGGTIAVHAEELGWRSSVFEMCSQMPWEPNSVPSTSLTYTLGVEAFANYLLLMLKYTIEERNSKSV